MRFTDRAVDSQGYPVLAFEAFYQQGKACHLWGLPPLYIRQSLRAAVTAYTGRFGPIAYWQLRAFVYGLRGDYQGATQARRVPPDYRWPIPPDDAWIPVICVYPDGECDLDFTHPVSRKFWSEDNGFPALPPEDGKRLNAQWFEEMGFTILRMQPAMQVTVANANGQHLKQV